MANVTTGTTMMMTTANVATMAACVAATECVVAWTWAKWVAMANAKVFAERAPIAA